MTIQEQIDAFKRERDSITLIKLGDYPDEVIELISEENFKREDMISRINQQIEVLQGRLEDV